MTFGEPEDVGVTLWNLIIRGHVPRERHECEPLAICLLLEQLARHQFPRKGHPEVTAVLRLCLGQHQLRRELVTLGLRRIKIVLKNKGLALEPMLMHLLGSKRLKQLCGEADPSKGTFDRQILILRTLESAGVVTTPDVNWSDEIHKLWNTVVKHKDDRLVEEAELQLVFARVQTHEHLETTVEHRPRRRCSASSIPHGYAPLR